MKLRHLDKRYSFLSAMLLGLAAFSARADYQSTVLSQGPVGYWRLDETVQPTPAANAANAGSLSAITGIYATFPSRGLPGPFTGSSAVGFNGSSSAVVTPYDAQINPNSFTTEMWVKPAIVPNFAYVAANAKMASPRSGWYLAQDNGGTFGAGSAFVVRLFNNNATTPSTQLAASITKDAGSWYHLVLTYDGTTAALYMDGALVTNAPAAYVANISGNWTLGTRSDNAFYWPGDMAEAAMYDKALTAAQVAAHYTAGTTAPATYGTTVKADAPIVYYRFTEPVDPPAANVGTLGAAANGLYVYNAKPGQAGPVPPTFSGLEAANKAVSFEATGSGAVRIPGLNLNTNTVTITGWINAKGAQAKGTSILMNRAGNTTAGLIFDAAADGLNLAYNWGDNNATYNWVSYVAAPDSTWAFVALIVEPSQAALFVGDKAAGTFIGNTNYVTHNPLNFEGITLIGADAGATNRNFNGLVDEVVVFRRALSVGEVYSQYAAAVGGLAPTIFGSPQAPVDQLYEGDTLLLAVDAGGSGDLTYQWRKGGTDIAGATKSTYTKAAALTDAGNYDVVVRNNIGSVTSSAATIAVTALATPNITEQPIGRTLYPGSTLSLKVVATGGGLTYKWQKNGTDIAGATKAAYVVNNAGTNDAGSYSVLVSNNLGSKTGGPVTVNVVAPAAGSYEAAVLADKPVSWWRLDDPTGSWTMLDSMGRWDGYYTNVSGNPVTLGTAGVIPGNTAASADGSDSYFGVVPYNSQLASTAFSLEGWAKVADLATEYAPFSFYDTAAAKKGHFMYADSGSGTWRAAVGAGANSPLFYYLGDVTGANVVPNKWVHLVFTSDSAGSVRWYVNGQQSGGYGNFPRNQTGPLLIGGIGPNINYSFKGSIDEVAFYTNALSQARVQEHYLAAVYPGGTAPVFTIQPASASIVVGNNAAFSVLAEGTTPIRYQWLKNGAVMANQTNTALAINKVDFGAAGDYQVQAWNSKGTNLSAIAKLSILPVPAFANATNGLVLHLQFEGDGKDSSGRGNNATEVGSPVYVDGKIGTKAFRFNTDVANNLYNYATLGTPADLQFSSNVNFTVSYWVRMASNSLPGDLPFLCNAVNSYGNNGLTFAPSYKEGGWSYSLNGKAQVYGAGGSINDGKWHNLVHSFDRAGNGVTYLDGLQVDSRALSSVGDLDSINPINIGQDPSGTYGETGTADIDDLGVWRRALTSAEASAIYYSGVAGRSFDTYGPVTMFLNQTGGNLVISWQAGTLVESTDMVTWTPVAGASAPNYVVTPGTGIKFYRIKL